MALDERRSRESPCFLIVFKWTKTRNKWLAKLSREQKGGAKREQNPTSSLWEILLTNKQTDKQTNTRKWLQYPAFRGIINSKEHTIFSSFSLEGGPFGHFQPTLIFLVETIIWSRNWRQQRAELLQNHFYETDVRFLDYTATNENFVN